MQSKKNRTIRSTIKWFLDEGAINEEDVKFFKVATDLRDKFAHDMFELLTESINQQEIDVFYKLIELYKKVDNWWLVEIELPTSGNAYDPNLEYDKAGSLNVIYLEMMADIALTGNKEYYEYYQKLKKETGDK